MSREEQAKKNREQFPELAKINDQFKSIFGEGTKMIYGEEGGKSVGKKPDHWDDEDETHKA